MTSKIESGTFLLTSRGTKWVDAYTQLILEVKEKKTKPDELSLFDLHERKTFLLYTKETKCRLYHLYRFLTLCIPDIDSFLFDLSSKSVSPTIDTQVRDVLWILVPLALSLRLISV
jgi:hypothetical protein